MSLGFFLISNMITGCVTPGKVTKTQPKKIEHYEIFFCENFNKDRGGPINITKKFIKGDGKQVYFVAKLMDLVPNSKYKFKFEWYKPNGKMYGTKSFIQLVEDFNWYTANWLKLDLKYVHPSGLWSTKIFANDIFLGSGKFLLADNTSELSRLEKKYAARLIEPALKATTDQQTQQTKASFDKGIIGKSWAVIIGLSSYKYSGNNGLPNLIFADDDAKAFANTLKKLNWSESHINLLINEKATRKNILIALESWLTKAGPEDQIVLFWAGHGYPDPEDPEKVYFACYDTDILIPATGFRMDRVRSVLNERKAKNVIVLVDTCHAGKIITRGHRGLSIVPQIYKMSRQKKVPKGWIFMVGADTDRQAIEHTSWANGAFTHSLIKGLSGEADGYQNMGPKDNIVTMGELRAYMNTAMPDKTQSVLGVAKRPVIATSSGDPDIWNLTLQKESK